jgi:threonine-phosphate decarboxylase
VVEVAPMTVHGGDVWQVAEDAGLSAADLLDFSANVNPRGLPASALARLQHDAASAHLLRQYPDRSARTLRTAVSAQLGVPAEAIVIGPGAEALMLPALRSTGAVRALVPVPAFSEYRRICAQAEVEFVPFPLDREQCFRVSADDLCDLLERERFGALILNNPHNPSGALLSADCVRSMIDTAAAVQTAVLLDEAFIDYAPSASLVTEAATRARLIVLRSLTKFYGCPALRVGYAVAHPDTASAIASQLPAWPVTQLALDALAAAVEDREYAEHTLHENAANREMLRHGLESLGLTVFPSAANYLLVELPSELRASELRQRLIDRHRILIRNCDSYENLDNGRYVRVAVLAEAENMRLLDALAAECKRI